MPAFYYIAIHHTGGEQKGVIEAESEKHARQLLRDQSLIPIKINFTQSKKGVLLSKGFSFHLFKKGLSAKELAMMTRQLATLLSAGLPVEESVLAGHALSSALREHPDSFSALFCATVAAGEKSGHLDKVLLRLADYTEQQWHMQRKLTTALIYPGMIVLVAIGIVGFLLEYVVPKMISVYEHLNQTLPMLTNVLIAMSDMVTTDGLYVVIILIASTFLWRHMLKKNSRLREKAHLFLLRIPLIRYVMRTTNTARFARTLSILSASGVPVLEAMQISAQLITTIPIRKAIELAVNHKKV